MDDANRIIKVDNQNHSLIESSPVGADNMRSWDRIKPEERS